MCEHKKVFAIALFSTLFLFIILPFGYGEKGYIDKTKLQALMDETRSHPAKVLKGIEESLAESLKDTFATYEIEKAYDKENLIILLAGDVNGNELFEFYVNEKGTDLFKAQIDGYNVIHFAATANNVAVVEFVKKKINDDYKFYQLINAKGGDIEETPLLLAAEGGNLEMVKFLIENGADITAVSCAGFNVFTFAIPDFWEARYKKDKCLKVVEYLIDVFKQQGLNVANFLNAGGSFEQVESDEKKILHTNFTALHSASFFVSPVEFIKLLVEKGGVDPNVKTGEGRTALDLANLAFEKMEQYSSLDEIRKYLKEEIITYLKEITS